MNPPPPDPPAQPPPGIPSEVLEEIGRRLSGIEREEGVRILFACESGSRAWGFASSDSDFDVRFIYAHPRDWYLTVERRRDVIERPISDDLDLSGWDLLKALRLFRNSNPPLLEWLVSPLVYRESGPTAGRLREIAARRFSPRACAHHYLHMARGNAREYLRGEEVWTKKYLYVLRPLLAVLWLEADKGMVPMEFAALAEGVVPQGALREAIADLVDRKRAGLELSRGPRIPAISDFIDSELARLESGFALRGEGDARERDSIPAAELDAVLHDALAP